MLPQWKQEEFNLPKTVHRTTLEQEREAIAKIALPTASKTRAVQFKLRTFMKDRIPVNLHRPESVHLYDLVDTEDPDLYAGFFHAEEVFDSITGRTIWIIKYSGGKDSTKVYCLAVEYLIRRPHLNIRLVVVRNDTLMDAPQLTAFADQVCEYAQALCDAHGIQHDVVITKPLMDDRYWVMVLGHGYPPFNRQFRPCTTRMKIMPSEAVMKQVLSELATDGGNMAVLMGVRRSESQERAERYAEDEGQGKPKKSRQDACVRGEGECGQVTVDGNAFSDDLAESGILDVYPILNVRTCKVWDSLAFIFAPLGWPTAALADIYGEEETRFGCWMCSLVGRVRDIENLAQVPGNEWLDDLLTYRADFLTEALMDENRLHVIHEEGRIVKAGKNKGKPRKGGKQKTGLRMHFRERKLAELLTITERVRQQTGYLLIEEDEVAYIRECWAKEKATGKRGKAGLGKGS